MSNTIELKVKNYSTHEILVPPVNGNAATTKLVVSFDAQAPGINLNVNMGEPTSYPESTYGAGKTISIIF